MLTSYVTGLGVIVVVTVAWVAVQNAWRRAFPTGPNEPDVLAARRCHDDNDCSGCGCIPREIDR